MAETAVFCVSGALAIKIGENVDATGYTEANRNIAAAQAESLINVMTRYNWSDNYSGLNADVKKILEEAAACWAAIDFIIYNTAGYTDRVEAEDLINVNWAKFNFLINVLKDQKAVTYTNGA